MTIQSSYQPQAGEKASSPLLSVRLTNKGKQAGVLQFQLSL
jgi:hypothetical protein